MASHSRLDKSSDYEVLKNGKESRGNKSFLPEEFVFQTSSIRHTGLHLKFSQTCGVFLQPMAPTLLRPESPHGLNKPSPKPPPE